MTVIETLKQAVSLDDRANKFASSSSLSTPTTPATTMTFVKATLSKLFILNNSQIETKDVQDETNFITTHRRFDVHYDFTRRISLPANFRHKLFIIRTGLSDVIFASTLWFWVLSDCGFTVPYRVWLSNHRSIAELTITKLIED